MDTITTTKCGLHGQPEMTLAFDRERVLERDVRWFAASLESDVTSGTRFQVGQSMQLGWMWAWITTLPDGTYGFEEPDMKSAVPLVRQPGLTNTLGHLRVQKDTLESVLPANAISFPTVQQRCLVCTKLGNSGSFFLERREPKDNDSGWIFGCQAEHDHNTAQSWKKTWLYSAVVEACRRALPYLAFPPGSLVSVSADRTPELFLNHEELPIRKRSYLDLMIERSRQSAV